MRYDGLRSRRATLRDCLHCMLLPIAVALLALQFKASQIIVVSIRASACDACMHHVRRPCWVRGWSLELVLFARKLETPIGPAGAFICLYICICIYIYI